MKCKFANPARRQRGAAAVEFALVAIFFFTLLLGIIEFGRAFYLFNTLQEATRNLARQAVVALVTTSNTDPFKQTHALFRGTSLPGGGEVTAANVTVEFLDASLGAVSNPPADQISECLASGLGCVAFVRVRISGATYQPIIAGFFPFLAIPLPASTVTMPAESMGAA